MMVGVPVLLMVWVRAIVPVVWVVGVVVGVFGWRVFQWCVAVVLVSRRVPGVVWLVSGVGGLVWACFGVVWLVLVGVCWLVCVVWFRMLTCLASFFLLVLSLDLFG